MGDLCQKEFQEDINLQTALKNFLALYEDLSMREEVIQKQPQNKDCKSPEKCMNLNEEEIMLDDSDMYYTSIASKLRELLNFLQPQQLHTINARDEL